MRQSTSSDVFGTNYPGNADGGQHGRGRRSLQGELVRQTDPDQVSFGTSLFNMANNTNISNVAYNNNFYNGFADSMAHTNNGLPPIVASSSGLPPLVACSSGQPPLVAYSNGLPPIAACISGQPPIVANTVSSLHSYESVSLKRKKLSIEEKRAKDAERKRLKRASMKNEEREIANRQNAQNMRDLRANREPEVIEIDRAVASQRMRELRENRTTEQIEIDRAAASQGMRELREIRTPEQIEIDRAAASQGMRELREIRTPEQIEIDRVADAQRKAQAYAKRKEREKQRKKVMAGDISEYRLSAFSIKCKHCSAMHFDQEQVLDARKKESFNDCCGHGRIFLEEPQHYPPNLRRFFIDEQFPERNNFFVNIRKMNSSFSCASLSTLQYKFPTPGPPCFRISGQVYHCFNKSAQPLVGEQPTNGQLFFVDTEEALSARARVYPEMSENVTREIETFLRHNNPYVKAYKMMKEEMDRQKEMANLIGEEPKKLKLLFSLKKGYDPGRYNIPTSNEVAAVFTCNSDGDILPANIVVHERGGKEITHLKVLDPSIEPMLYPLYYPWGTEGWSINIKDNKGKKVSMAEYVRSKLAIRKEIFTPYRYGRKLFQQWVVDQYARIESDRLTYVQLNQKKIKAASYKGLDDYLHGRAEINNAELGRRVVLPSSHVGSPRYLQQCYNDAMSLVRKFGKPDLFITMTCNPQDPDIVENLEPGQSPIDRPDLVARVFNLKKKKLLEDIIEGEKFGKTIAHCYVIEFQKRGLPHMHLLVTLAKEAKMWTGEEVDRFISAELPDPEEDPLLFELINKMMMHGPCDDRCLKNGKCSKNFPKDFVAETELNAKGYPSYKRPDNGRQVNVKGQLLDNRYVVPHNPDLLKRYRCHINVEKCSDIEAVKYLYKYIYKGYDSATVDIVQNSGNNVINYDEVVHHLECRYIGPVEACWRIFEFDLQGKSHSIERLPLHLEGESTVYYDANAKDDALVKKLDKKSKLEAFFDYNKSHKDKKLLYAEIPEHGTWKDDKWCDRKNKIGQKIGRMYTVSPAESELFHLRLLLLHVRGPVSYADLKYYNDVPHETFAQSCLARGLIEDDAELEKCLREAAYFKFPRQLRNLFVTILIHCSPKEPEKLWEKFKDELSYDMRSRFPGELAYEMAYFRIVKKLVDQGKDLERDFPTMPKINLEDYDEAVKQIDCVREGHLAQDMFNKMNDDQKAIYNRINTLLDDDDDPLRCLFIDGPGGTGKTYEYKGVNHLAKSKNKKVINTAFSGIASTLLPSGKTNHKVFGLPVNMDKESVSSIQGQTKEAKELKETDIIIWDEAPMSPKYSLEIADRLLRDIKLIDRPFGGTIMLLGGDFRQVLPIKQRANRTELVNLSIKRSVLWNNFQQVSLTRNMRARGDALQFAQEILAIGDGVSNDDDEMVPIPSSCIIDKNELAEQVFGNVLISKDYASMSKRAILAIYNVDVNHHNDIILNMVDEMQRKYFSIDSTDPDSNNRVQMEVLHSSESPGMPPHILRLKRHCVVMLIRNLNVDKGLCNGTRLRVLDLKDHLLHCIILTGDKTGKEVFIPRITIHNDSDFPFVLIRRQFPVKLAFSLTINKSQGQSFDFIGIDFSKDSFSHGQTYVGVSRSKAWDCIKVVLPSESTEHKVKNVVYKEIL
jgi:hypothetical protein